MNLTLLRPHAANKRVFNKLAIKVRKRARKAANLQKPSNQFFPKLNFPHPQTGQEVIAVFKNSGWLNVWTNQPIKIN